MSCYSDYVGALQCENKILKARIAAFESGERYVRIQQEHSRVIDSYIRKLHKLASENAELRREIRKIWKHFQEAYEDACRELDQERKQIHREMQEERKQRIAAEQERDLAREKQKEIRQELYQVKTELEEAKERIQELRTQLDRNYENSSIPSSQCRNRKKITNSREKTGKKPGAQPGHCHHGRKKQIPTRTVCLQADKRIRITGKPGRKS